MKHKQDLGSSASEEHATFDLGPVLRMLLGETARFLLGAGLARASLVRELRRVADRLEQGGRAIDPRTTRRMREGWRLLVEAAGVVHDWTREPNYTNDAAEPIELTREQLSELILRRFDADRVPTVLQWMQGNGLVRRTAEKKFALSSGRQMIYTTTLRQQLGLGRAAVLVPQYFEVVLQNAVQIEGRMCEVDRDARVYFLPEELMPLWKEVLKAHVQSFLEGVDNWLEDHAQRSHQGPVREVAVHCYSFSGARRSASRRAPKVARGGGSSRTRRPRIGPLDR